MAVADGAQHGMERGERTPRAREVVERFVRLMERQDLAGIAALYEPEATWEVHIPSWDGLVTNPADLRELHEGFVGRDRFRVVRYQIVEEADLVGLCWDLSRRDLEDGAPCVSFQSHFFEVAGERIRHHRMYCAGVRAVG